MLTVEHKAVIVAFRRQTLLPLDDCLHVLRPTILRLRSSSSHRCLQRHGISQLPKVVDDEPLRARFGD